LERADRRATNRRGRTLRETKLSAGSFALNAIVDSPTLDTKTLVREQKMNVLATIGMVSLISVAFLAEQSPASEIADLETLDRQVNQLEREGRYFEAVPLATKLLDRCKELMGAEHPATAVILDRLARLHDAGGEYTKAEALFLRALKIYENALGPDDVHTAATLNNLAELYRHMGVYAKAEPLYERVLKIDEKIDGLDGPNSAAALNNLGLVYTATGRYANAERIFARALAVSEKTAGSKYIDTAATYNNLAQLYEDMGDYAKAEPLYLRALKIEEKALGAEHPNIATLLSGLGTLYLHKGDFANAEPLLQRALRISEKVLGPKHPSTAQSLNNLALLYKDIGDYAKAQSLYERALKIREKVLGQGSSDTATSVNNLAGLYCTIGDYARAETLYQRSLRIYEKTFGSAHPRVALGLNNLADLYRTMGAYAKAELLCQRALRIDEAALGEDHPETAVIVNNLGTLYNRTGDFAKAEPFLKRNLRICEKALGPEHPTTAAGLNNLASLYKDIGDYTNAVQLFERALKIREKVLGQVHPDTAISLMNLAGLYLAMGEYARSEPLFQRAITIYEKCFGAEHSSVALSLANLGDLYLFTGAYAKAEPLYQRALKIDESVLGEDHPDTALILNNLGGLYTQMGNFAKAESFYRRSIRISETTLGSDHPQTATALTNLAFRYLDNGKLAEATELVLRVTRLDEKRLADVLSFTSEQQRLAFQLTVNPYSLLAGLNMSEVLAQTIVRRKGVVLDSLLEDRLISQASEEPRQRGVIAELLGAKERFMQVSLEVPKELSNDARERRDTEKQQLFHQIEELEGQLARQVGGVGKARRALNVTVEQVQSALGKDEALIELARYNDYLGKNKWEWRYGAILIASGSKPEWCQLGSAVEIEKTIRRYQISVRGETDEIALRDTLRQLHTRVWLPIEKALPPGTKRILLSPDGELNFVSFATLLAADEKFLAEKYSFSYAASGRDLLKESKLNRNQSMLVFANPDFGTRADLGGLADASSVALRSIEMRDLQKISLPPLPGTATEAAALERLAGEANAKTTVFLGSNATEAELRRVDSPRILHVATHGFFLPESELGNEASILGAIRDVPKGKLVNPMHRSGLALAGAQETLQAWSRGEVPPIENDGIVTAEEVGGLRLDGTWLVVLSACDTGSGEARTGEGVMGLRRGFIQAGAQNLLMTLWPISDETTVQIMLDFYDTAFKSGNAPQALADTQRDWLVKLREERGLLPAVQLAGPFIMSSQGKP
jgi:tetratricopeptide (TPR) repeat protein